MATSEELRTLRRQKKDIGEEIKDIKRDIILGHRRIKELQVEKKELFKRIMELKLESSGVNQAA